MPKRLVHNYSHEDLNKAINAIRNENMPIREASRLYNVPRGTLQDRIHGRVKEGPRKMGPDTVLTIEEENRLVQWIIQLSKCGFPVRPADLLNTVQKIVVDQKRQTPFKEGKPGKKWYYNFRKRHPELTIRTPESVSKARAVVTEEYIRKWFRELLEYLEKENYQDILHDPTRIYNCDETSFCMAPKTGLVLAPRGIRNFYEVKNTNEKDTLTVLLTISANGDILPPLVFPYVRPPTALIKSMPDNWILGRSESGWMRSDTFYDYIANDFNKYLIQNNIKKPVILFVDGHRSHLYLDLSDFCSENNICLYALPPNTTHILQPADVGVFRGLKSDYRISVAEWHKIRGNEGKAITKFNFCEILQMVLNKKDREIIVKNSFKTCGLYPFNADAIDYSKCIRNVLENFQQLDQFQPNKNDFKTAYNVIKFLQPEINDVGIDSNKILKTIRDAETKLDKNVEVPYEYVEDEDFNYLSEQSEETASGSNNVTVLKQSSIASSGSEVSEIVNLDNDNNSNSISEISDTLLAREIDLILDLDNQDNNYSYNLDAVTFTESYFDQLENGDKTIINDDEKNNTTITEATILVQPAIINDGKENNATVADSTILVQPAIINDGEENNATVAGSTILVQPAIINDGEENNATVTEATMLVQPPINNDKEYNATEHTTESIIVVLPTNKIITESNIERLDIANSISTVSSLDKFLYFPKITELKKRVVPEEDKLPMSISSQVWKDRVRMKVERKIQKENEVKERKMQREKNKAEKAKGKLKKKKHAVYPKCAEDILSDAENESEKGLGCDYCKHWFHLKCSERSHLTFDEAKDLVFMCTLCL